MSILTKTYPKEKLEKTSAALIHIRRNKIASHISKFSSPDAPATVCIYKPFDPEKPNDGYIYSENTESPLDISVEGGAAFMAPGTLAITKLEDGRPFYLHLLENDPAVRDELLSLFDGDIDAYEDFRNKFLTFEFAPTPSESAFDIPQIYYELEDYSERYLLSILHPSALMFRVKEDILQINTSTEDFASRLFNITETYFGGSNARNISVGNAKRDNSALLLPNLPPKINTNYIRKPKRDFFAEMMYLSDLNDEFLALSKALHNPRINLDTKQKRKDAVLDIFDYALIKVFRLREFAPGWTDETALSEDQKKWIDSKYQEEKRDAGFMKAISLNFAVWLARAYEKKFPEDTLKLNDDDIHTFATDVLKTYDSAEV